MGKTEAATAQWEVSVRQPLDCSHFKSILKFDNSSSVDDFAAYLFPRGDTQTHTHSAG